MGDASDHVESVVARVDPSWSERGRLARVNNVLGFVDYTERFGDEAALRTFREYDAIVRGHVEACGGDVMRRGLTALWSPSRPPVTPSFAQSIFSRLSLR